MTALQATHPERYCVRTQPFGSSNNGAEPMTLAFLIDIEEDGRTVGTFLDADEALHVAGLLNAEVSHRLVVVGHLADCDADE